MGIWGHWGYPGGQTFFLNCNVAYQINEDDEQNKMQVTFYPRVNLVTLGRGQKVKKSLTCQFQRFSYQTLCVFSQIKDRKHIEQNFHSVAKVMLRLWDCGVLGESKPLAWGFAMAPHRLRALVCIYILPYSYTNTKQVRTIMKCHNHTPKTTCNPWHSEKEPL